jgi:hypothetical protein
MKAKKDTRTMTVEEKVTLSKKILAEGPDECQDKLKCERIIKVWSGKKNEN